MPTTEQHCNDCVRKLGQPFPEVHAWLDALSEGDGSLGHRDIRHNLQGVEEIRERWGDEAAQAALIHIMLDWGGIREDQVPRDQEEAENLRIELLRKYRRD